MTALIAVATVIALLLAGPRWLRVAQREHYLAGSTTRFALRWWRSTPANIALAALSVIALGVAAVVPPAALVPPAIAVAGPIGLSWRGRTSALVWTRRVIITGLASAMTAAAAIAAALVNPRPAPALAAIALLGPLAVDCGLALVAPFERRTMNGFVRAATAKLRAVDPMTVAITGSYGKTTTKLYARHLIAGSRSVLASPASFNNTGGLSRTMNEHLAPGTEVLIAEMGTYGVGEIAAMCAWVQPRVSALVNIGPVHLERMKTLETIVRAKREIFETAEIAVLNIDAFGLAAVAEELEATGQTVLRASTTDRTADIAVIANGDGWEVFTHGHPVAVVEQSRAHPANVAVAIALARAVGVDLDSIARRLGDLPDSEHRQRVVTAASGALIIDNTFSSNPASAVSSLEQLERLARGKRIIVTPGMVELGSRQRAENHAFGAAAAKASDHLLVVGRTNRRELVAGAAAGRAVVQCFDTREAAVNWVRSVAGPDHGVLYEGDLPDHYP